MMTTTLRSNRRTRRNTTFSLEYLDERIVLSGVGAEAHVAALIAAGHVKAAAAFERHEARIEKIEAKAAAHVTAFVIAHPPSPVPTPPPTTPIHVNPHTYFPMSSQATTTSTSTSTTAAPASMVPATTANPVVTTTTPPTTASSSSSTNTGSPVVLPPNVSAQLQSLYTQYEDFETTGGSGTFAPTGLNTLVIKGTDVGINFQSSDSADFNTMLGQLQSDGLQVVSSSAYYGVIEGMVPIAQLPAIAQISSTASVTPMYTPMVN